MRSRAPMLLLLDVVAVVAFAAVGRESHAEGVAVVGVLGVAAPFLLGAAVGALTSRSWRDPLAWRSGLATWVGAVVVGLALRALVLERLPLSFAIVATVALGVLLLGWRVVARLVVGSAHRPGASRRVGARRPGDDAGRAASSTSPAPDPDPRPGDRAGPRGERL